MRKLLLTLGLITIALASLQAQTYTVSGYITDAQTKEVLIGCSIFDNISNKGATTNSYGFYSIRLKKGQNSLLYSYIGYEHTNLKIDIQKDTTINILLQAQANVLDGATVTYENQNKRAAGSGVINIPIAQIKKTPSLFGERDMIKTLQGVPGVQASSEGKSDLSVRGGSPDQNLILLDGIPIYNTNHIFGFLSIFNSDALKKVTLYKSNFPSRFGGRLSSVIDITTKDGNKEKISGAVSLGLLTAKVSLEGPIIKDKTSFTFSGRRSFADLILPLIQDDDEKTNFSFYDINAKVHHKIDDKTSAFLMFYKGNDMLTNKYVEQYSSSNFKPETHHYWQWGNSIAALRLNRSLTQNCFAFATLSYNRYKYNTSMEHKEMVGDKYSPDAGAPRLAIDKLTYDSGITDYTGSVNLEYIPNSEHYIRGGISYTRHNFTPEIINKSEDGKSQSKIDNKASISKIGNEVSVYIEDDWSIANKWKLNVGLNTSIFNTNKRTYHAIDPRISLKHMLSDKINLFVSYTHMQQYIHLLSSNSILLQTDLWVPSTEIIEPLKSKQYSVGFAYNFPKLFNLSVDAYYKDTRNVLEYKEGASFSGISVGWENKVEAGKERAYGIELSLEKTVGKTMGIISYTLAKSERQFNVINQGAWFPSKFDRRHNISILLTHKLSDKIDCTLNWVYSTGNTITIPMFEIEGPDIKTNYSYEDPIVQLESRNNYRLQAHHRLDIGVNFYSKKQRNQRYGVFNLSVYNVYNRMNPFQLYVDTDFDYKSGDEVHYVPKLKKFTLFPIMPSISYTYNF